MVTVKLAGTMATNWNAIQMAMSDLNCISVLKQAGLKETDPAALPAILVKAKGTLPYHAMRFATIQILVLAPKWEHIPMQLDSLRLTTVEDPATGLLHDVFLLSGTADSWKTQIMEECQTVSQDTTRRKVFNACCDLLCSTGFRTLFEDCSRTNVAASTYLLKHK